jgi:DNA-binding MarR family transcriptional regulator
MLIVMPTTESRARTPELASQLRMVVMRLGRRLRQQASDITPSQLSALHVVVREGALSVSQLAEAERVQPPTISRVVDSLVERGLVDRVSGADDRRVVHVVATDDGRALVEAIRRRRDAYLARHLRALSAEERDVLARAAVLLEGFLEDPV